MYRPFILLLPTFVTLICSCRNETDNTYAIKDFRKSIRPILIKVTTDGIVTYRNSSMMKNLTDKELILVSKSENPILRTTAIEEMFSRNSFDGADILMKHLDDTALVAADYGEFGIQFETVTDYLIKQATWKTAQARDKTIETVLTKHMYLNSAYKILLKIEAQEKYYVSISNMIMQPSHFGPYAGEELPFYQLEYALYGLAKFQKKEDIAIIRGKMMKHIWELSDVSLRLIKEFPDASYMDVLEAYHKRQFYKFSGNRPHGFTGFYEDRAAPEDFITALVVQQNDRSARLLETMLNTLPAHKCMPDYEGITANLIEQIWQHPCAAYYELREKIKHKVRKNSSYSDIAPLEMREIEVDTTKRLYYW